MTILVTGGAGFIGSNFILDWLAQSEEPIVNLDKLTYAGNPENLSSLQGDARHVFVQGDPDDRALVDRLLAEHKPRALLHCATESHADRSIHGPEDFIQTNIVGIFRLLEAVRAYWSALPETARTAFRFLQVSTDKFCGTLSKDDPPFAETNPYEPNSRYSASKAASDLSVHTVCALLDELRPKASPATKRKSPTCKTAPATTGATASTRAISNGNSAGSRPKPLRPASARPCSSTW